jgi:mannose-6-phosphate isomerase-like protein (cupin superfamily)
MHMRVLSPLLAFTLITIVTPSDHAAPQSGIASSPTPLILNWSEGERRIRRPGTPNPEWPFTIKVDGQNGNAQDFYMLSEIMDPGQKIAFHKHHNAEEILILEEGGATVIVGDKRATVGPHAVVFIPRETWVSVVNSGKESIHLYAVFSRQGYEEYGRAISVVQGQPATAMTADDIARARASGHATYWDTSKGPYPPGVARP